VLTADTLSDGRIARTKCHAAHATQEGDTMARKRYTIIKRRYAPGGWTIKDNSTATILDDYEGNKLQPYSSWTRAEAIEWADRLNADHDSTNWL
jgi:hypothetical protein